MCESGCVIGSGQGANFIKISVKNMSVKGGFAEMSDLREKNTFSGQKPRFSGQKALFRVKSPFSVQNPVFSSKKVI